MSQTLAQLIKGVSLASAPAGSLTVDSSGRLLVGTSTARANFFTSGTARLQVEGTTGDTSTCSVIRNDSTDGAGLILANTGGSTVGATNATANGGQLGILYFMGSDGTSFKQGATIQAVNDQGSAWASGDCPARLVFSTTADGASSPTEHLRVNQAGGVKMSTNGSYGSSGGAFHEAFQSNSALGFSIRCTNASYADTGLAIDIDRNTTNSTYNFIQASCTGVQTRFAVRDSGNVVNVNNSYGAISDIKLKENIVDATSQWSDIKALQVRKYNFKEGQTHTQIGLIAQEVELVSPGLVTESPDRDEEGNDLGTVTKSVNYSVLYMKAVKALQEAMERIEQLEAKVAALEAA